MKYLIIIALLFNFSMANAVLVTGEIEMQFSDFHGEDINDIAPQQIVNVGITGIFNKYRSSISTIYDPQSITAIDLLIAGYRYDISEVGFIGTIIGGSIMGSDGITGYADPSQNQNDFVLQAIVLDHSSGLFHYPLLFDYTSNGYKGIFNAGRLDSFSFTAVPDSGSFLIIGSFAIFGLAIFKRYRVK